MVPSKTFLFYLLDTFNGKAYYRDANNTTQSVNIATAGVPVDLKHAPGNWLGITLAFDRNMTYFGLNRSYTTGNDFVLEVKDMITELTLLGVGVEQPLSLGVWKLNSQPIAGDPTYKLYYKAPLDLPEATATLFETFSCNLMEGGVSQLLKNYENTTIVVPCDGSLPENIKANYDGMYVQDRLFYETVSIGGINNEGTTNTNILPMVFLNNEGDNFGCIKGNPSLQTITAPSDLINNQNSCIYFNAQTTVTIKGDIVVQREGGAAALFFGLWRATSKNNTYVPLIPFTNFLGYILSSPGQIVKFSYEFTITLDAY